MAARGVNPGHRLACPIFQPRIAGIFTNRERLRRGFPLLELFVFIPDIRGSRTFEQDGQGGARTSMRWRRAA